MRRRILLLQGPVGPFFKRLADELDERGFEVSRINLNGGDRLFYRRPGSIDFTGALADWPAFLERYLRNNQIERIYLFGDCRAYHQVARKVAAGVGASLYVFEEGYVRPNFITLDIQGVNGYAPMLETEALIPQDKDSGQDEEPLATRVFAVMGIYAMLYYMAAALSRKRFPHYQHHRDFRVFVEGWRWVISGLRKLRYKLTERQVLTEILQQFDGQYFACPLQVHCDTQVIVHSRYHSIEHFIGEVFDSFAAHAPANKALVFKHHPMDRGYTDFSSLIANLTARNGLQGRVFYVHDVCLPTLLQRAQGCVLINSTVGLSSLFHQTPVKVLGKAIYDFDGLTAQVPLGAFWSDPGEVSQAAVVGFRNWLIQHNQINGSFYRCLPRATGLDGLSWAKSLLQLHSAQSPGMTDVLPGQLTVVRTDRQVEATVVRMALDDSARAA